MPSVRNVSPARPCPLPCGKTTGENCSRGAKSLTRRRVLPTRSPRMLERARMATREERIAAEARRLGFPMVGCTPLVPLARERFLAAWLAEGRAGEMHYLE